MSHPKPDLDRLLEVARGVPPEFSSAHASDLLNAALATATPAALSTTLSTLTKTLLMLVPLTITIAAIVVLSGSPSAQDEVATVPVVFQDTSAPSLVTPPAVTTTALDIPDVSSDAKDTSLRLPAAHKDQTTNAERLATPDLAAHPTSTLVGAATPSVTDAKGLAPLTPRPKPPGQTSEDAASFVAAPVPPAPRQLQPADAPSPAKAFPGFEQQSHWDSLNAFAEVVLEDVPKHRGAKRLVNTGICEDCAYRLADALREQLANDQLSPSPEGYVVLTLATNIITFNGQELPAEQAETYRALAEKYKIKLGAYRQIRMSDKVIGIGNFKQMETRQKVHSSFSGGIYWLGSQTDH